MLEVRGEAKSKLEKELQIKRMLEAKRIAKSQEQKHRDLQKQIDRQICELEQLQMVMMGKEQFNKHTHLNFFKRKFGIDLSSLASLKKINGMLHSYLNRVPGMFPKYRSCWMRIIYKCLNKTGSLEQVEHVGYFEQICLSSEIEAELLSKHPSFELLESQNQSAGIQAYNFLYKLSLDLDMDVKLEAGIQASNLEKRSNNSL